MQDTPRIPLRLPPPGHWVRALAADRRGVAALELALIVPVLGTLLLGVADVALADARARELDALATIAAAAARAAGPAGLGATALPLPASPRPPQVTLPGAVAVNLPAGLAGAVPAPTAVAPVALPLDRLVSLPADIQGTLSLFSACAYPGRGLGAVAPGTSCADGRAPALFARISLQAPLDRLLPWPAGLLADQVATQLVVRVDG